MPSFVLFILIFVAIGGTALAANLVLGWLVRPDKPSVAKGETYECGEIAVGNTWGQFDLRFYVVALLFVIFDVELAFFFPWAVVFGSANRAGDLSLSADQRIHAAQTLDPGRTLEFPPDAEAMSHLAWIAFADILIFFGILIVGFAYLWRRGDLDWVRSVASQTQPSATPGVLAEASNGSAR